MGAMDARNMQSKLAVNKYLHTVASCWILSIKNHDARNHEYKINYITVTFSRRNILLEVVKNVAMDTTEGYTTVHIYEPQPEQVG